jgi:hypothetical protein
MSNALALAGVSAVLKDLLNNGLIDHDISGAVGGPVTVTVQSPDRVKTGDDEKPQLNLFLYQVSPNAGWNNVGLPSRDAGGARLTNRPLALDLHYLLTAYGKKDFDAEILLGYAMQLLHETPVLAREAIRAALGPGSGGPPVTDSLLPPGPLAASDLADQVELIKISPQNMNTEELSKLWTALQAHYRPTAAYHLSVVLIESRKSTKTALPVLSRNVYVFPFEQPFIEEVGSDGDAPITLQSTLVLTGRNLKGEVTLVRLGELELPPPPLTISPDEISFPLATLTSLRAGVQTIQVVHQILMGTPETTHRGFESNAAVFMLQPAITVTIGNLSSHLLNGATVFNGTVTVHFVPRVDRAQRVLLLLNEFNAPNDRPPHAYTFPAPTNNGIADDAVLDTDTIAFPVSNLAAADYLVRVQVDGAQSLLGHASGQYDSPRIAVA